MKAIFFSLLVGFNLIFSFSTLSHAAEQTFIGRVKEHYGLSMYFIQLLPDGEDKLIFPGASYELPDCITSAIGSSDRVEIIGEFINQDGSLSLNLGKDYLCNPVKQNNSPHDESQNVYNTELPLEISIIEKPHIYGTQTVFMKYIHITSLVDAITIEDVIINRGNMKYHGKFPVQMVFGTLHPISLPYSNDNVKEVKVITNQGEWVFNWNN